MDLGTKQKISAIIEDMLPRARELSEARCFCCKCFCVCVCFGINPYVDALRNWNTMLIPELNQKLGPLGYRAEAVGVQDFGEMQPTGAGIVIFQGTTATAANS